MRTLLVSLIATSALFAQAPASAQDATTQALLKEVHALRMALEQSNQIGPRVQIALARMQLQEERVRNATRQLQEIRDRLSGIDSRRLALAESIKRLESAQLQAVDPQDRKKLDAESSDMKAESEHLGTQLQQLRAREGECYSAVIAEQARWNEADDLLKKIERSLAPNQ